jgi:cobalt transporter subunit CbtB
MNDQTLPSQATIAVGARGRVAAAAVVSVALGMLLLWGVGFAHSSTLHNTAHDTRHSFSFPCH